MGDEQKADPKTKAAVVAFEVSFKEIGRIYDVNNFRRVVGSPDKPKHVWKTSPFGFYSGIAPRAYDHQFEDELGSKVSSVQGDMPGVYQGLYTWGKGGGLRTFSRKHAEAIEDKWVYVFASNSKDGSDIKLAAEVYFKGGDMQLVDLQANAGKNERQPSGEKRKKLVLTLKTLNASDGPYYWFLLAPYQIPWGSLARMVKSGSKLASRCMRAFDEFYTDGIVDGGQPKNMHELIADPSTRDKPISFLLYLLDPFKEALIRAEAYATYVETWQKLQTSLGKKPEYVLAKRIHNLPARYVDAVWHKLGSFLYEEEKLVRMLLRAATLSLEDLVCWIGELHRREAWGDGVKAAGQKATVVMSDTWFFLGEGKVNYSRERKTDSAAHNAFSDLVGDYNDEGTSEATYTRVGEVVAAVHARLEDLPRGQDFLENIVRQADRGKLSSIADGGAKLLFEAARKGDSAAAEVVGGLLKFYAPKWVEVYKKNALPALIEFMEKKHQIELKKKKPREVRRVEEKLAKKLHKKAARKGIEKLAEHYHLSLETSGVRGVKMSDKAFSRVALGIEVFNMKYAISEFSSDPDIWSGLGLLGSTIDAYNAIGKLIPKVGEYKFSYSFGGVRKAIKVAPILAVVSSAIDTVLAGRDAYNATNFGQGAGHTLRTIGAALTVGGALAAETGVGVLVAILGLGLQAVGSGIASQFDDMKQFLRHSKWGDATTLDSMSNWFSDSNNFGYTGDLDDLRKDINAQLRALDWMFWVFKPEFADSDGADGSKPGLALKMNPPKGLSSAALWTITLDINDRNDPSKSKKFHWTPPDNFEHAERSSNEELYLLEPEGGGLQAQGSQHQRRRVHLKGEIKLDVYGDGSAYVVRRVDKNIDLSW